MSTSSPPPTLWQRLLHKVPPRWFLLCAIDAALVAASLVVAYLLRFDFSIPADFDQNYTAQLKSFLPWVICFQVLVFVMFGLYRGILRYASVNELLSIIGAASIGVGLLSVANLVVQQFTQLGNLPVMGYGEHQHVMRIPWSVLIIFLLVMIVLVGGFRFSRRLWIATGQRFERDARRVLVVGSGDHGESVVRSMLSDTGSGLRPVALVTRHRKKVGMRIHGLPVLGELKDIGSVLGREAIEDVVLAMENVTPEELRTIVSQCEPVAVRVNIAPSLSDIMSGRVSVSALRPVQIEDLLAREPVRLQMPPDRNYLKDERVLITGAGGSIGSELCRQVILYGPDSLILLGKGENSIYEIHDELRGRVKKTTLSLVIADIRDPDKMERVFREYQPTIVFHAAAHKHVPLMETAPDEAVKNNVLGTAVVAHLADRFQAKKFILVSTDKAVKPTSVMGATKRVAEQTVFSLARDSRTAFYAVRFGNVLGSRGSVIPLFKRQIERGGPVTVTHPEVMRYFMTTSEAVSLILQAGAIGLSGQLFTLDMGQPIRITDLARNLIVLSGLKPDVDIKIEYTGLRPGEKLKEEILTEGEGVTRTELGKLFTATPDPVPSWKEMGQRIDALGEAAQYGEPQLIRSLLAYYVPDYLPQEITPMAPGEVLAVIRGLSTAPAAAPAEAAPGRTEPGAFVEVAEGTGDAAPPVTVEIQAPLEDVAPPATEEAPQAETPEPAVQPLSPGRTDTGLLEEAVPSAPPTAEEPHSPAIAADTAPPTTFPRAAPRKPPRPATPTKPTAKPPTKTPAKPRTSSDRKGIQTQSSLWDVEGDEETPEPPPPVTEEGDEAAEPPGFDTPSQDVSEGASLETTTEASAPAGKVVELTAPVAAEALPPLGLSEAPTPPPVAAEQPSSTETVDIEPQAEEFLVLYPVYSSDQPIDPVVRSLQSQIFGHFNLEIVDCTADGLSLGAVRAAAADDHRVRFQRSEFFNPAQMINRALEERRDARYLLVLPPRITLLPECLAEVHQAFQRDDDLACAFADFNILTNDGDYEPVQLLDWSPGVVHERHDFGFLQAFRGKALREAEGVREDLRYAADYDLLLRLTDDWTYQHIAKPLGVVTEWDMLPYPGPSLPDSSRLRFPGEPLFGGFSYLFYPPEIEEEVATVFELMLHRRGFWIDQPTHPVPTLPAQPTDKEVSVVIPVRNGERLVANAIQKVLHGTLQSFEILVADAGSGDRTREVVQTFMARDRRVRLIVDESGSRVGALNQALRQAHGRFIAQVEWDDELTPDCLEKMVAYLKAHPDCALAVSSYELIDEEGRPVPDVGPVTHAAYTRNQLLRHDGVGAVRVLPRAVFQHFNGYDARGFTEGGEEYDLALKISEQFEVGRVPEVLYRWRWWEGRRPGDTATRQRALDTARLEAIRRRREMNRTQT